MNRNAFTNADLELAATILTGWKANRSEAMAAIAQMLREKAKKRQERAGVMREARARGCNPRFVRRERGEG